MKHINISNEQKLFLLIILINIFKFSYLGYCYVPYLDDYTQYFYYPSFLSPWKNVLTGGVGTIFTRPFANILDIYFWSLFSRNLGIAVLIISILHAFSGIFFYKAFNKWGFYLSPLFFVFYLLMPSLSEGTYWLSASSRVVCGLFFTALSLYFISRDKYILFSIFNFISYGFYEQIIVISFFVSIILIYKSKNKKLLLAPFISLLLFAIFYFLFGQLGDNAERLNIISLSRLFEHFSHLLSEFTKLFTIYSWTIFFKGFFRGALNICESFSVFWIMGLSLILILWLSTPKYRYERKLKSSLSLGIFLTVIPLAPFFLCNKVWLNFRNIVPSALGIAIVFDAFIISLFKKYSRFISAFILAFFIISNVSEICDYERTARSDYSFACTLAEEYKKTGKTEFSFSSDLPIYLSQNMPYNDHIMSARGSDWGPSGIVRSLTGNPHIIVLPKN